MRSVTLTADVPGADPDRVYARLSDLASYPAHSDAVRSVTVTEVGDADSVSRWEVSFRNGLLRWTEQDRFDPAARRIDFTQLEGDVEEFRGSWTCAPSPAGTTVVFAAEIDLGIPTLAMVLEPIAARALLDNTASILRGLFGQDVAVRPGAPATAR